MEVELRLKSNKVEENNILITIQGDEQDVGEASSTLCARFELLDTNTRPKGGSQLEVKD